jgi:ferredoxin
MRVIVDKDVCGGHGDCAMTAPEVFDFVGDDDVVSVLIDEPPAELQDSVREACEVCPTGAISVRE